ncbi:MAG TPA: hypothetical protein VMP01_04040, partial [Pirellulaceae bacterium]|nr:hypothetical protein [Pirellulaceae bacterium]
MMRPYDSAAPVTPAAVSRLEDRAALLRQLDELRRNLDRREQAAPLAAWEARRQQAMRFVLAS